MKYSPLHPVGDHSIYLLPTYQRPLNANHPPTLEFNVSLPRTLEPVADSLLDEANEYQQMDHTDVNRQFVVDLLAGGPVGSQVIDLGCGPAQIPIELCRQADEVQVMGIDGEPEMLELAKLEVEMAGMLQRISLQHGIVGQMEDFGDDLADTVISNSLMHHLDAPQQGLATCLRLTRPGGRLFIRDLARPDSEPEVEKLVVQYTGQESEYAQQLFRQSLHASLTLAEVQDLVRGLGIDIGRVQMTSDRHWTLDTTR